MKNLLFAVFLPFVFSVALAAPVVSAINPIRGAGSKSVAEKPVIVQASAITRPAASAKVLCCAALLARKKAALSVSK